VVLSALAGPLLAAALGVPLAAPARQGPVARVEETGHVDCFEKGLRSASGQLLFCETSAVTLSGDALVFANDKRIDPHPAIFALRYAGGEVVHALPSYLELPPIARAVKYEALTTTPDGAWVIASTGFDRVRSDSPDWDVYNTVLAWPAGDPAGVRVVSPSTQGGVTSSVGLRPGLSTALATPAFPAGVPYFKVEGLAALPGGTLLFGVREKGASYESFDYVIEIVSVSYEVVDGELRLGDDFALAYRYDPSNRVELGHPVALSDLAYDPGEEALLVLTSFEGIHGRDELGGFLWTLPLEDLAEGRPLRLVRDATGQPIRFPGKPEGITPLGDGRLFVVQDDDRVLGVSESESSEPRRYRESQQATYTILALEPRGARGARRSPHR